MGKREKKQQNTPVLSATPPGPARTWKDAKGTQGEPGGGEGKGEGGTTTWHLSLLSRWVHLVITSKQQDVQPSKKARLWKVYSNAWGFLVDPPSPSPCVFLPEDTTLISIWAIPIQDRKHTISFRLYVQGVLGKPCRPRQFQSCTVSSPPYHPPSHWNRPAPVK